MSPFYRRELGGREQLSSLLKAAQHGGGVGSLRKRRGRGPRGMGYEPGGSLAVLHLATLPPHRVPGLTAAP